MLERMALNFNIRMSERLDADSMRSLDPYPDSDSQSGSESRRTKINHKNRKQLKNLFFEVLDVLF
jgi:hypothetical protein